MRQTSHVLLPLRTKLRVVEIARQFNARALLESGLAGHALSRFSYIGIEPLGEITAGWDRSEKVNVTFRSASQVDSVLTDDPINALRALLGRYHVSPATYTPSSPPFHAGAIGCIGYDARHFFAKLPSHTRSATSESTFVHLMLFDEIIIRDEATGETWLSVVSRGDRSVPNGSPEERLNAIQRALDSFAGGGEVDSPTSTSAPPENESPEVRSLYEDNVRRIQDRIAAGDSFEVCLTRRIVRPFEGEAYDLYAALRRTNPSPFASLLRFDGVSTVFASPERFVSLDANRTAETCPIKGTRRRGATHSEDTALRHDLATNEKDRAEHTMAVDVARNDLGRVCEVASVQVSSFQRIEAHPAVFQMVSDVRGTLLPGRDALDLIGATFPGASMTGAPKVQAMKLIDELETSPRGFYSGAIGYIDFSGTMDLSMAIRGIVLREGVATIGTGGAIVSDSDPSDEFDETELKARAMLAAVSRASRS